MTFTKTKLKPVLRSAFLAAIIGAFATPGWASEGATSSKPTWPANSPAQRDFPVDRIFVDRVAKPGRVWLIATPTGGIANAVEFFTGEEVESVHIDPDGKRITFSDARGHDYTGVKARTLAVNLDEPSSYAGWQAGDKGHEVILGAQVGPNASGAPALSTAVAKKYFDGKASCEPVPYVVRTQGSTYQSAEPGFIGRTKIIADFDKARDCYTSKPLQAVNLEDNTFLLITQDRVFRIDTKNLTPSGLAPDIKIIDIKDQ